jgi:hypothetical protein
MSVSICHVSERTFDLFRRSILQTTWRSVMTKRELIDTGNDKRYVRRDKEGKFKESVDVGRSLSADKRHDAKNEAKPGEGDKGDHER